LRGERECYKFGKHYDLLNYTDGNTVIINVITIYKAKSQRNMKLSQVN